jgi:hypothetical protein
MLILFNFLSASNTNSTLVESDCRLWRVESIFMPFCWKDLHIMSFEILISFTQKAAE